jgi:hypothetical protein
MADDGREDLAVNSRFVDAAEKKYPSHQFPNGVLFRFYEELNDYLPEKARKKELRFGLKGLTTVRMAIAALGIPRPGPRECLSDFRAI